MSDFAFIACRVPSETKARVRRLAERDGITESALLRQLLDVVLRTAGPVEPPTLAPVEKLSRESRRTGLGVGRPTPPVPGPGGGLPIETDDGEPLKGKGASKALIEDWDLELDAERPPTADHKPRQTGKQPKLVYKMIFSMPAGTVCDPSRSS